MSIPPPEEEAPRPNRWVGSGDDEVPMFPVACKVPDGLMTSGPGPSATRLPPLAVMSTELPPTTLVRSRSWPVETTVTPVAASTSASR